MKYTAGDLAKKLGVSARTVRFYDEKKLLIPCDYSEAGYRLYDENSAERLQKIIMLRFLDLTLEQIYEVMKNRHNVYNETMEYLKRMEAEGKVFLIQPKHHFLT